MKSMSSIANTSDEAVQKSTGKTWSGWLELLSANNAQDLSHKEIVKLLKDEAQLKSGWWQQMITNTYEQFIGRRKKGEMDGGFQIGVSKTFAIPGKELWEKILSTDVMPIWLGATNIPPEKEPFKTNDNINCELRIFNDYSHLRLRWQPGKWNKPSTLQVRVTDKKEKSTLSFHHENLPDAKSREVMKQHWKEVAANLHKELNTNTKAQKE